MHVEVVNGRFAVLVVNVLACLRSFRLRVTCSLR